MIKIHYKNGAITFITPKRKFKITRIDQIYLVQDQLRYYLNNSETKQKCCMFIAIIDMLMSAKKQFIQYNEKKCLKNWL